MSLVVRERRRMRSQVPSENWRRYLETSVKGFPEQNCAVATHLRMYHGMERQTLQQEYGVMYITNNMYN